MHINFILILLVAILGVLFSQKKSDKGRLYYIVLCCALLLFVAAMRSPEWFTQTYHIDTLNYKNHFESSLAMEWNEIWFFVRLRYYMNVGDFDVGYIVLNKLIGFCTNDFAIYSLIADLLFFVPFGYILYKYCTKTVQVVFAFVFYIALVQIFLLGGARQMFALGFHMMALIYVVKRKRLGAIVLALLGISIHFSSFIFVVPLVMIWHDLRPHTLKLLHILAFIVFPFVFLVPNELIMFMGDTISMEKYAEYGRGDVQGGGTVFIFLIEMLSIFCLIAIKERDILRSSSIRIFYTMAPLFTLSAPLIRSNGVMIRMSLYFHLFLVLLVPYAIECFSKEDNKNILYTTMIGALAFLALSGGGIKYFFYWQI